MDSNPWMQGLNTSTTSENEPKELRNLASLLSQPAFTTLTPINEAIRVYRDLSRLKIITKSDNKKISRVLRDLLFQLYQEQHYYRDLEIAVIVSERVAGSPTVFARDGGSELDLEDLEALGILLYHRALQKANPQDIEKCVQISRIVADHTPSTDPRRAARLEHLSGCLFVRFKYYGDRDTLDECLSISTGVVLASDVADDAKITYLHNLTIRLLCRSEKFATQDDLKEAEKLSTEALALVKEGHQFWPELLLNRSRVLFARFRRSHFWRDLDEATTSAMEAIQFKMADPLKLVARNQNLAVFYLQSFQLSQKPALLKLAHKYAAEAVNQSKEVESVQNIARETLLEYFQVVFTRSGQISHLQNILDLLQDQADDLSDGPLKQEKRDQYTKMLCLKYRHTNEHLDLVFLCFEALRKLLVDKVKEVSAEEVADFERKLNALTYLFGELYRLLLVPEYIDVRDALTNAIHATFLDYVEEGIPDSLTSFLKKHEIFSIRLDVYGRNVMEERESIIGGSSQSRLTNMARIMEEVGYCFQSLLSNYPLHII
jgi:hypothetical protein